MNVAFVYDNGNADGTKGGAELTMEGFAACCPSEVAITDIKEAEVVVVGNCVQFNPGLIPSLIDKKVYRYHHDLARHEDRVLRAWLDENAEHIFTSPMHRQRYGIQWDHGIRDCPIIPPQIDFELFRPNRQQRRHPERHGVCSVAAWQNPGKGGDLVSAWARDNDVRVDVYGPGAFVPTGSNTVFCGALEPDQLAPVLHQYERMVFLPLAVEPFGRCVAEAWVAGCELVVNENVGVKWFIENDQDALHTAGKDFWGLILNG